jgi:hypothetical protein
MPKPQSTSARAGTADASRKVIGVGDAPVEASAVSDGIHFHSSQCVDRVPEGEYIGELVQSIGTLGGNGMQRVFRTVRLTRAPAGAEQLVGRNMLVWFEQTVTETALVGTPA